MSSLEKEKTTLDNVVGGLSLMIIFTTVWAVLAVYFAINVTIRGVVGGFFSVAIIYLIANYIILLNKKKHLPKIPHLIDPRKNKWYIIILMLEGAAILIGKNVLVNIDKDYLFISYVALIVGLHFIPLAKVFDRKFDYYIGAWTTIVALFGFYMITQKSMDYKMANTYVCTGCGISTLFYGMRMIKKGKQFDSSY